MFIKVCVYFRSHPKDVLIIGKMNFYGTIIKISKGFEIVLIYVFSPGLGVPKNSNEDRSRRVV